MLYSMKQKWPLLLCSGDSKCCSFVATQNIAKVTITCKNNHYPFIIVDCRLRWWEKKEERLKQISWNIFNPQFQMIAPRFEILALLQVCVQKVAFWFCLFTADCLFSSDATDLSWYDDTSPGCNMLALLDMLNVYFEEYLRVCQGW